MMVSRLFQTKLALFLFVVAPWLGGGEAEAFVFIRAGFDKGARPVSRAPLWTGRSLKFRINTDQTAYGGSIAAELTSAEFESAVNSALTSWSNVCHSDITVELVGTTTAVSDSSDGINTIVWDNRTTGEGNQIASVNTLAVALSSVLVATDFYVDCDIVVNGEATGNFGISGESTKYDLVSVLAHEIGHCLGLDHSVEAPTYTSTNSILNNATMAATVSAGNIGGRTISQDEVDAMECVHPEGKEQKSGTRCGSYHGTNNNGALSGVVTGGPASEVPCDVALTTTGEKGSGCITKALAAERRGSPRAIFGSFFVEMFFLCMVFFLVRAIRRRFSRARSDGVLGIFLACVLLGLLAPEKEVHALVFEPGLEYRRAKPVLMNKAASLISSDGTYTVVDPAEIYTWGADATLSVLSNGALPLHFGVYARYLLPNSVDQVGLNASRVATVTKTTTLSGYGAGPMARLFLVRGDSRGDSISAYVEALIGLGKVRMEQKIVESGTESSISSSATSIEATANLGFGFLLSPGIRMNLKLGYSRYKTNALSVDSVSGTKYGSLKADDRLAVNDGGTTKELVLDRSGYTATLSFSFEL